jgi:hypothetical protein
VRAGGVLEHVDAEHRAPAGEADVRRPVRRHGLHPVDDRIGEPPREGDAEREDEGERTERGRERAAAFADGETQPRRGEDETGEHDAPGGRDRRHQGHAEGAAEPGTQQVREVEAVDARGVRGEDGGDREPRGEEGDEEGEAERREPGPLGEGGPVVVPGERLDEVEGVALRPGDDEVAGGDAERPRGTAPGDEPCGRDAAEPGPHRDGDAARADAEEGHADDQVGEVVEGLKEKTRV